MKMLKSDLSCIVKDSELNFLDPNQKCNFAKSCELGNKQRWKHNLLGGYNYIWTKCKWIVIIRDLLLVKLRHAHLNIVNISAHRSKGRCDLERRFEKTKLWISFWLVTREVDKVLSGLEILSKVFDQQSAFMVSKMIQQVQLFASLDAPLCFHHSASNVSLTMSEQCFEYEP